MFPGDEEGFVEVIFILTALIPKGLVGDEVSIWCQSKKEYFMMSNNENKEFSPTVCLVFTVVYKQWLRYISTKSKKSLSSLL